MNEMYQLLMFISIIVMNQLHDQCLRLSVVNLIVHQGITYSSLCVQINICRCFHVDIIQESLFDCNKYC